MIFALVVIVLTAFATLARGGSLDNLARLRLRGVPILLGALLTQVALDTLFARSLGDGVGTVVLVVTNLAVVGFLVANRTFPGMAFVAAGLALNVTVIVANGAMPVSMEALDIAGITELPTDLGVKHEWVGEDTRLVWLADVIPLPRTRLVLSLGDLVLALGLARFVYAGALTEKQETPSRRTDIPAP